MGLLQRLGYRRIEHYPGGLTEWFEAETDQGETSRLVEAEPRRSRPKAAAAVLSTRWIDWLADRSVGQLFALWVEVVVVCGVGYWMLASVDAGRLTGNGVTVASDARGLLSAIYFSAVTATSVGYGDIVPIGAARVVAIGEGIAGLILFGCVVSKFVSRRQEQVIGEIHRIAFEDRLGRVRTNLHLVRTEVQATTQMCEGHEIPPPAVAARVESTAMVFVGELRAVHDLLYRPQDTPDEAVLEGILAGLASVFREFNDLLMCVHPRRTDRTPVLTASLSAMSRLAHEICGECVPREFAPALRVWMDQIQRTAVLLERE